MADQKLEIRDWKKIEGRNIMEKKNGNKTESKTLAEMNRMIKEEEIRLVFQDQKVAAMNEYQALERQRGKVAGLKEMRDRLFPPPKKKEEK